MILEELVGAVVSLGSLLISQPPQISRENKPTYSCLKQCSEDDEDYEGTVLHREYAPEEPQSPASYNDPDTTAEYRTRRSVGESLRRTIQVNLSLLPAIVLLGVVTIALVYYFDIYSSFRLPDNVLFLFTILLSVFLAARKFKKINPASKNSVWRIFFCLSFSYLGATAIAYIYTYVIVERFIKTQNTIKAMIAALTPGMMLLPTAIAKYIILRRSSEFIPTDKAFVTCYYLRSGAISLYRTMQSDFQNIWLFTGLSLLHGVSNVLSKATLNLRIKMWKCFLFCVNKTRWGSALKVLDYDTPRTRRLDADLEIENILFEYTTVVLGQAYLVMYLLTNFEVVHPWKIIKSSLFRIGLSTVIDFFFNIISVFIQIHFYDIPMRRVWSKHWGRHVIANTLIIICLVSYFGAALVSVFQARDEKQSEYRLRNCTSFF
ncbi:uncharacterized protein LOC114519026 [Dendronephthya gigantea]|uniref:uncharacterized protein LOC114519026 n=1 Tax=Dendronephthya gigantea TaxID=151771 RepID=UPI00106A02CD|nr:uncharacterized protein LOC114519026 [Dendronephthya gigantea]